MKPDTIPKKQYSPDSYLTPTVSHHVSSHRPIYNRWKTRLHRNTRFSQSRSRAAFSRNIHIYFSYFLYTYSLMITSPLDQFYTYQKNIQLASSIWNILANDQNNRMPPEAQATRSDQLSYVNTHIKQISNDRQYQQLVSSLYTNRHYDTTFSKKDIRCIELAQRGLNFSTKYSDEFTNRFAKAKSATLEARHHAKSGNDRTIFAPALEASLALAKEYASIFDVTMDPFDVWLDGSHPGMTSTMIETLFEPILRTSKHILSISSTLPQDTKLHITEFSRNSLYELLHELLGRIWFDFKQGRLDVIGRPYSENCWPGDERIHISDSKPLLESILAWLHECGHGLTDMCINPDYHWTNIHRSLPIGIHESQARTLENFVGRSKPFCVYLTDLLNQYFWNIMTWDAEEVYQYLNHVSPELIRTHADELTYNIHIYIRYIVEKELFAWTTSVSDVPHRRAALYKEHLWVEVHNDAHGALQDQHWALGLFWYFPAYTIGNCVAAQLWEWYRKTHPHRGEHFMEGDFSHYISWYQNAVWRHGNMYHPDTLIKNITWKSLTAESLERYLDEKYLAIPWAPDQDTIMIQERAMNEALISERYYRQQTMKQEIEQKKAQYDEAYQAMVGDLSYMSTQEQRESIELIVHTTPSVSQNT